MILIEIKSGSKVASSALRGLSSFLETCKDRVRHAYVITSGKLPEKLTDKITVLPWRFL